jgi:hypothetical protein
MSHPEQLQFVASIKEKYPLKFRNAKVLEVGSLDINGSVRQFFTSCTYIGIDVGEGKGVDEVAEGQAYNGKVNSFDTIISCECFEHNPHWVDTFNNMIRMTKKGGLIVMTCATTGRPEHGTTRTKPKDSPLTIGKGWDYYQNLTEDDFTKSIDLSKFSTYEFTVNDTAKDLYFYGIKK